ncbi:MAG: HEAT repeat domain-containing protein, partial [Planctomycetota bacterium]|nr:HEAT repeat domain-containing protein [Planctomycetota bacterium]
GSERERAALLRWIGTASPVSYAEVVEPFIDAGTVDARSEAIVALEQLASEDSVKALLGALKKAKDETIEKNLLRAIGACGPGDRKVRSALLKASEDVKNPLARQNALLALGWAENDEGVSERLRQAVLPEEFAKKSKIGPDRITELEREAAVVAMGISRDEAWTEMLTRIREDEEEPQELRDAASASLEVIAGGEYRLLRDALMRAGSDEIPRDRLFRAAGRERRR